MEMKDRNVDLFTKKAQAHRFRKILLSIDLARFKILNQKLQSIEFSVL